MESKIRPQLQCSTTNHGACMCIESAQSKRGRRKGYEGVRLQYAVVVPRPSFSSRAAILSSRSSRSSSSSSSSSHTE